VAGDNPAINLLVLLLLTIVAVTEQITNNVAPILMFPLAQVLSAQLNASLLPFVTAIMFGASASFLNTVGYQTNLLVQGPGGYQFTDYFKIGFLLSILVGIVVVVIASMVWSF